MGGYKAAAFDNRFKGFQGLGSLPCYCCFINSGLTEPKVTQLQRKTVCELGEIRGHAE